MKTKDELLKEYGQYSWDIQILTAKRNEVVKQLVELENALVPSEASV